MEFKNLSMSIKKKIVILGKILLYPSIAAIFIGLLIFVLEIAKLKPEEIYPKASSAQIEAIYDIRNIELGLKNYYKKYERFPTTEEGLNAVPLSNESRIDPWGKPYIYKQVLKTYQVETLGADGTVAGLDDNKDIGNYNLSDFKK